DAGLEAGGDVEAEVDVFAPEGGGEAVAGVVGERHRLVGGAEAHGDQHRAEDLLGDDAAGGGDVGDPHGAEEPAAALGEVDVGLVDAGALGGALFDEVLDARHLHRCDQGADVDGLVERVADAQRLHAAPELVDETGLDGLLDEQARAGAADLALVEPDGVDQALDGAVDVGVLEDDVGRLAAELEGEAFAGAGGRAADQLADLGGAGEGDLLDIGVGDDGGAGVAHAGDDIDDARRQAGARADL